MSYHPVMASTTKNGVHSFNSYEFNTSNGLSLKDPGMDIVQSFSYGTGNTATGANFFRISTGADAYRIVFSDVYINSATASLSLQMLTTGFVAYNNYIYRHLNGTATTAAASIPLLSGVSGYYPVSGTLYLFDCSSTTNYKTFLIEYSHYNGTAMVPKSISGGCYGSTGALGSVLFIGSAITTGCYVVYAMGI